jgi:hypothetical protein
MSASRNLAIYLPAKLMDVSSGLFWSDFCSHPSPSSVSSFMRPHPDAKADSILREKVVYPTLSRFRINPKPISRITAGFVTMACTIGYTAGIQDCESCHSFFCRRYTYVVDIYKSPPCYDHPLKGSCSDGGRLPNDVRLNNYIKQKCTSINEKTGQRLLADTCLRVNSAL